MKTCQETLEIYSAWIDGEATPSEIGEMQKHLDECLDCRTSAEEFRGLSRDLREDTTDYLRVSSQVVAQRTLVKPELAARWPSKKHLLMTKIWPTIGVGAWSALLFAHPLLFPAWPVLAIVTFLLARNLTDRSQLRQIDQHMHQLLRPFAWGTLMLTLLPTSAMLGTTKFGAYPWQAPVEAGLATGLAALAGIIWGVWRQVNPQSWRRARLLPILAGVTMLCLGNWSWAALLAAFIGTVGLALRTHREVAHSDLEGVSLRPHYPAMVLLVDVAGVYFLYWLSGWGPSTLFSPDLLEASNSFAAFRGDWTFLLPLLFMAWWVLLRNPLAALLEWSHGRNLRWLLAGVAGVGLALTGWLDFNPASELNSALAYGVLVTVGAGLGLLLASRSSDPISPNRSSQLAQRVRVASFLWTLAVIVWFLLPELWNWKAKQLWPPVPEPLKAAQIRQHVPPAAPSNAGPIVKPLQPVEVFVGRELSEGLDAEIESGDLAKDRRTLGYLRENLEHLDQALAAHCSDPQTGKFSGELRRALWFRAEVELREGKKKQGFAHLLKALDWNQAGGSRLDSATANSLVQLLAYDLTAQQYRILWNRLSSTPPLGPEELRQSLDRGYRNLWKQLSSAPNQEYFFHLPPSYYQHKLANFANAYLRMREQVSGNTEEVPPEVRLSSDYELWTKCSREMLERKRESYLTESALAALGLYLYHLEKGTWPNRIEQVESYLGRPFANLQEGHKLSLTRGDGYIVVGGHYVVTSTRGKKS